MRISNVVVLFLFVMLASAFGQVEEYVLQPGDVISINVVEHPEFSGRHKIRPDGRINYPVIGELDVASLTPAQLVKIMQGKLSSYINNPVVSIAIESYYANKIYTMGAIGRTGEITIFEPLDVLKAIAIAGGLKDKKAKLIKIIRADGTIIDVDLKQLRGDNAKKRDVNKWILYPGDTLYAPEGFKIPWGPYNMVMGTISSTIGFVLLLTTLSKR